MRLRSSYERSMQHHCLEELREYPRKSLRDMSHTAKNATQGDTKSIPWTFLRRYIWVPRPKYLGVEKYSYSVTDHGHSHLPTTIHTQMISYPLGGINVRRQHVDLSGSSLILHTSVLQYLVSSLKWLSPHWTPEKLHFAWPQSMKYADFVRLGVSCFVARCTLPRLLRTTHWRTAS